MTERLTAKTVHGLKWTYITTGANMVLQYLAHSYGLEYEPIPTRHIY